MNTRIKRKVAFRPSVIGATLEARLVLSSAGTVIPPPAPAPLVSSIVIGNPSAARTVAQIRNAYTREVELTMVELRSSMATEIGQLFASGAVPNQQALTDFNASVQGSLDATALQLSSQASLLPASGTSLVPAIQNSLLGSGSSSLSSELSSVLQSDRNTASAVKLESAFARDIIAAPRQLTSQFNKFFASNNLTQLSVNTAGQRIPLSQYMGGQAVNQLSNTIGLLAQSFPNVANSVLFPDGASGIPSQALMTTFGTQITDAVSTAAFQLGSSLSMFTGFSSVASQLASDLLGSTTNLTSLASTLENLPYGSAGFNSAVTTAFNTGFNNLLAPISSYLGMATQGQSNQVLPTSGLTSLFSSQFSGSSFDNGFNNGFASDTATGFVGFGSAPSDFNPNIGLGFGSTVATVSQGLYLGKTSDSGGVPFELF